MFEKLKGQIEDELAHFSQENTPLSHLYRYHFESGGKRLRGILSLLESQHLKSHPERSLKWATACELLHNATLIHDDIQDNDPIRRGRPSLWKQFDAASAINLGDQMIIQSFGLMTDCGDRTNDLLKCLTYHAQKLVEGQALEFALVQQKVKDFWLDYSNVAYWKTGSLLQAPIQGLHILKGLSFEESLMTTQSWIEVGLCYQICDDIRDFLGTKQDGQIQKDFEERRINSLIALLSQDKEHHGLINEYLDPSKKPADRMGLLLKLNNEIHNKNIIPQLQGMVSDYLEVFSATDSHPKAKEIILSYLNNGITQKEDYHEQRTYI